MRFSSVASFPAAVLLTACLFSACDMTEPERSPVLVVRLLEGEESGSGFSERKEVARFVVPVPDEAPAAPLFSQSVDIASSERALNYSIGPVAEGQRVEDVIFYFIRANGSPRILESGFLQRGETFEMDAAFTPATDPSLYAFSVEGIGTPSGVPIRLSIDEQWIPFNPERYTLSEEHVLLHVTNEMIPPSARGDNSVFTVEMKPEGFDPDERGLLYAVFYENPQWPDSEQWKVAPVTEGYRTADTLGIRGSLTWTGAIPENLQLYVIDTSGGDARFE